MSTAWRSGTNGGDVIDSRDRAARAAAVTAGLLLIVHLTGCGDYITSVAEGAFYGWPYSYCGRHVDARVLPPRPDRVERATTPDFAVGTHTGSRRLAFSNSAQQLPQYADGAFVGQHGSWNRRPPLGYRVIFVPFANGRAVGPVEELLTGFLDENGQALGRPVGVAIDRSGALLVADDVGNTIWRVTQTQALTKTTGADSASTQGVR